MSREVSAPHSLPTLGSFLIWTLVVLSLLLPAQAYFLHTTIDPHLSSLATESSLAQLKTEWRQQLGLSTVGAVVLGLLVFGLYFRRRISPAVQALDLLPTAPTALDPAATDPGEPSPEVEPQVEGVEVVDSVSESQGGAGPALVGARPEDDPQGSDPELLFAVGRRLKAPINELMRLCLEWRSSGSGHPAELDSIESLGLHLSRLVDETLQLGQVEAEQDRRPCGPVDIVALCRQRAQNAHSLAHRQGVRLRSLYHSKSLKLDTDQEGLELIVDRLLRHVLTATPKGREAGLEVSCNWQQGDLEIRFWDEGPTPTAESIERLFDLDFPSGHNTQTDFSRTGLGLPFARRLALRLGGELTAESRPSRPGARFLLSFPLPSKAATAQQQAATVGDPGRRLLLVEDNDLTRKLLGDLLSNKGYQIRQASDGREALNMAQQEAPDLILTDIQLPGELGGLDVIRSLRQTPELKEVPVLALSAYSRAGDIEQCITAGADGFVRKPIGIDALVRAVESQLKI